MSCAREKSAAISRFQITQSAVAFVSHHDLIATNRFWFLRLLQSTFGCSSWLVFYFIFSIDNGKQWIVDCVLSGRDKGAAPSAISVPAQFML
jgi:hypothetical protein